MRGATEFSIHILISYLVFLLVYSDKSIGVLEIPHQQLPVTTCSDLFIELYSIVAGHLCIGVCQI